MSRLQSGVFCVELYSVTIWFSVQIRFKRIKLNKGTKVPPRAFDAILACLSKTEV